MSQKATTLQVLTANLLAGGSVVFLARGGRFVDDISAALVATNKDEAKVLELAGVAAKDKNLIVDPYVIDVVSNEAGEIRPTKFREVLRTRGPSVRRDLGYQADLARPQTRCA